MEQHDFSSSLAIIPRRRDQLLPALHAVHHVAGWLPEAAIEAAGRHVFVPLSEVYGIVTSYSELRLTPPDADRVEVCTGLSCRMAAADDVAAALEAEGRTVERVPCRFLCAVAPVIEHRGRYQGRVDARAVSIGSGRAEPPFTAVRSASRDEPGSVAERRAAAVEQFQHDASLTRMSLGDGVCARAAGAGAGALDALLIGASSEPAARPRWVQVGCDGDCHAQPAVTVRRADGTIARFARVSRSHAKDIAGAVTSGPSAIATDALLDGTAYPGQTRRVLARCGVIDPSSLDEALAAGAYLGWERALAMQPEDVIDLVRLAGLRGRGGAYFPTHIKWASARVHPAPRYLVVNAEEGEPGVFKDRHLMEGDPHALVEGVLIAAYAIGAERAFIYINGQADLSARRVAAAVDAARAAGLAGRGILGSAFSCEIEIYRGAGGYVCGEESVILNSIEGERAVPRFRPPLPTEAGLWGRPTVLNNVETLVNLPLIVTDGPDAFREIGTDAYPGTKLMSLSGALVRPGLVEAPMGTTIREIIEVAGGGALAGQTITAAVVGGPSGGLLPASMFDLPIAGGMLHESGPVLGAGGIVVLDERTPLHFALRELTAYNTVESCGKCTPCREGTARALTILDRTGDAPLSTADRDELFALSDVMQTASLCGLGQMAPGPIRSALTLFE